MGEQFRQRKTATVEFESGQRVVECRFVNLQAHQAVGRCPRAGREGAELLAGGQSQAKHGPVFGGRQGERLQFEVEPGQRLPKLRLEAIFQLVDRLGNFGIKLGAGARGHLMLGLKTGFVLKILVLRAGDVPHHRTDQRDAVVAGLHRDEVALRGLGLGYCRKDIQPMTVAQKQFPHHELRSAVVIERGRATGGGRARASPRRALRVPDAAAADRAPRGPSA